LPYTLYAEGPPFEDCDLITVGVPYALLKRGYQLLTAEGARIDAPLLQRLQSKGFRLDFGEDGTGWQYKYLTRGGGYYFNVGCSDLIADGEIGLVQMSDIECFVANGARLRNGDLLAADLVVLATGYKGQEHIARALLGDEIVERIGPIWGFGDEQELRNMFRRTAQPGLWFMAGSFAQCRIYSKYLGLQIKACELGLIRPGR
jgi:putative flavoprotein involved in K+ transport